MTTLFKFSPAGASTTCPLKQLVLKQPLPKPLANIFDNSIKTEDVPTEWRIANVVPTLKMGNQGLYLSFVHAQVFTSKPCVRTFEKKVCDLSTQKNVL